jgi:hypothetical protein
MFAGTAALAQHNAPVTPDRAPALAAGYGKLPLSFEPNQGQTSNEVQWLARGPQYTLFLAGHDAVLEMNSISPSGKPGGRLGQLKRTEPRINSSAIRMSLLGAKTADRESGEEPQPGKANYFTGKDPSKWQRNVPMYGKVRLDGVYPGIDLVYYGRQAQLEYDFVVAPGADPSAIRMNFEGAKAKLEANGDLVLPVNGASTDVRTDVRFDKPTVYQMKDGAREPVDGSFAIAENGQASFKLGSYDKSRELIIDPKLVFLGALGNGAGGQSVANGMAVDADGEIILTGIIQATTFPTTTGALQTTCNTISPITNHPYTRCGSSQASSGFVTKISADGKSLVYSTYLHGLSGNESGEAVAVDSEGNAVILGATSSNDFPVTSDAYLKICQPIYTSATTIGPDCDNFYNGGGTEYTVNGPVMFIVKLDPAGSTIVYGTFFGGTSVVFPVGLALDSLDNIYFTGFVQSAAPASQITPNTASIQYQVTPSAYQMTGVGEQAAALSVLSKDGHKLIYSTFMGTSLNTPDGYVGYTQPLALAVGPNGMAYVAGQTTSMNFPTTSKALTSSCVPGAPGESGRYYCNNDYGFLSAFDVNKSGSESLVYSTFIGPAVPEPADAGLNTSVLGVTADSSNNVYITGLTGAYNFPTTDGTFQTTCNHANNANACDTSFLTKINPEGTAYVWSTYFGGTNSSQTTGNAIALDERGLVYLYGYNNGYSCDFPSVNPISGAQCNSMAYVATFTSDAKQLIFASPIVESPNGQYAVGNILNNGIALDSKRNIYVAAQGNDGGQLATTSGTYNTPATNSFFRSYFAKISPVLPPVATPVFSPAGGIYTTIQTVTLTSSTPGATIYYATHGVTPTIYSTKYTGPITVSATESIEAIAVASTFANSALATAKYTINLPATDRPAISPAAGTYTTPKTIAIADKTAGAVIYYTTDGTTPTTSSTKYAAAFKLGASGTVKAIALAADHLQSSVASAAYVIETPTDRPVISPAAGTYATPKTIAITDASTGAVIYYTTNGTTPTGASTKYSAAFKVSATATVKAIAIAPLHTPSSVASSKFTIETPTAKPVFSPVAGSYKTAQTVTISDTTKGAVIYFTTNGAAPTTSSTKYTAGIKVSATETIKAVAIAPGFDPSAEASAAFTIQ